MSDAVNRIDDMSPHTVIAILAMVFKPSQLKDARDYLAHLAMRSDGVFLSLAELRDIWTILDSAQHCDSFLPKRRHDVQERIDRARNALHSRKYQPAPVDTLTTVVMDEDY